MVVGPAGCGGPLSTIDPAGPVAGEIALLWWAMLAGAAALTLMVLGLVALGFGRPRPVREGRWTLALGLWFSLAVLTALLAAGMWVGERLFPRGDAVVVEAHAYQWGWRFTHPGGVETEGVLHIPARTPVEVVVTSADVIHSFWVPRLAGKIDAIPGRENRLRIEAAESGRYAGTCAEFCGLGHAGMRFAVVAHAPEDWEHALREAGQDESPEQDEDEQ